MKESVFMRTITMHVYGLVQGVGFRYMTKKLADSLEIKGIVTNLRDGSVYIEAQGDTMNLQQFISKVKLSPSPSGHVDHYEINSTDKEPYSDFSVTYS